MPPRRLLPLRDEVTIRVDGEDVPAERGEPIAVALAANGRLVLGRSVKYHRPRGAACYAARCDGCLMRVDGAPSKMTCRVPCEPGRDVETQNVLGSAGVDLLAATDWFFPGGMNHHEMFTWSKPINRVMQTVARRVAGVGKLPDEPEAPVAPEDVGCDLVVIGAGPSGLACAAEAAGRALSVIVIDEEERAGGSLAWTPGAIALEGRTIDARDAARSMAEAATSAGATIRTGTAALAIYDTGPEGALVIADDPTRLVRIRARRVVIAQGRHEGAWPFEGNDLPGVIGSAAAARLLAHGVLPGERIVIGGEGDAIERLAAALREAGAQVTVVAIAAIARARGRSSVSACDVREGSAKVKKLACDAIVIAPRTSAVFELAQQAGAEVAWRDGAFEVVASREDGATRAPWARVIGGASGVGSIDDAIVQARAAARAIAAEVRGG